MRRRALALEKPRSAKHQRARANTGDIARRRCLPPEESECFRIIQQGIHARTARHADQIKRGAIRHGDIRQNAHAAIGLHGVHGLGDQMHLGIGEFRENLIGAGQVQLGDFRKQQKTDFECHGRYLRCDCRMKESLAHGNLHALGCYGVAPGATPNRIGGNSEPPPAIAKPLG